MTVKEARKILGKEAIALSDEDIQRDIDSATFLKDLFFNKLINNELKTEMCHNLSLYGYE